MNKRKFFALFFTALIITTSACSFKTVNRYQPVVGPDLMDDRFGTRYLAYEIYGNLSVPSILDSPIIVTTFVDLNDLEKTSVFGRMLAEKLLDELNRRGFSVAEVRRSQDLFIKKMVGELILTRDISELANFTKARAVLAGTYVATSKALIINARLIDIKSPQILSSVSYEVVMTEEIENLIRGISPF